MDYSIGSITWLDQSPYEPIISLKLHLWTLDFMTEPTPYGPFEETLQIEAIQVIMVKIKTF